MYRKNIMINLSNKISSILLLSFSLINRKIQKNTIVKILRFIAKLPKTKLTGINANNKLAKKVLEEVLILFNMLLLNLYTKKNEYKMIILTFVICACSSTG